MFGKRASDATVNRCRYQLFQKPIEVMLDFVFACVRDDERPYLVVDVLGVRVTGLLDSGASQTVMGESGIALIKKLGLPIHVSNVKCSVANDSKCEVEGVVSVPFNLSGQTKIISVLLVPDLRHTLILGIDFWRKMGVVPDLRRGEWSFSCNPPNVMINALQSRAALSSEDEERLASLLNSIISPDSKSELGHVNLVEHRIKVNADTLPIKQRYYPISPAIQKIVNKELDAMIDMGVVEKSNSPWASPILLVAKKDGTYRFCVDYRQLNRVTQPDAYPLPQVSWILDRLRDAKYLSSIDIKTAYWQIPMANDSKAYTAFTVPGRGLYHFNRMPFGLTNAPATWQRFIDEIIGADLDPHVFVYLDDIIIVTPTVEKHFEILEKVCTRLRSAGLALNADKCQFFRESLRYLGYVVDGNGLHVDPEKVKAILEIAIPKKVSEVRRIVGMASWYRRFIPNFATVVSPLTALLKKNNNGFVWTNDCTEAWERVKECLVTAPILTRPDFEREFVIQTDASDFGIGAVLTQESDDGEKVICYLSRSLTQQERKFSTTEKECLAVLWAIEKLRPYVEGSHFTVITDHYSLVWLNNLKSPSGRLARWAIRLQQYRYTIKHRKGKDHVVPDGLSRSVPVIVDAINDNRDVQVVDAWYENLKANVRLKSQKFPLYRIEGGKLFKKIRISKPSCFGLSDGADDWRIVLPKHERLAVLRQFHDAADSGGHLGVTKTVSRITKQYYWPKLRYDVQKYIRGCKICQQTKPEQRASPGIMRGNIGAKVPWEEISIDLMGPLPRSSRGFAYIFVVYDLFSKFPVCFPLRQATAASVVRCLEEGIFLTYGVPRKIISDNGVQFRSNAYSKLLKTYKVMSKFTPFYHAQANPTERVNRTLKTMLIAYVNDNHRKWDLYLNKIVCALRTAKHEVTGYTPYFVNYGREMILTGTTYENRVGNKTFDVRNRGQAFPTLFKEIHERIKRVSTKALERYNLRRKSLELEVGAVVWRRNFTLSDASRGIAAKMLNKFVGPFRIKTKISPEVYELEDMDGNSLVGHWHISQLKLYNTD